MLSMRLQKSLVVHLDVTKCKALIATHRLLLAPGTSNDPIGEAGWEQGKVGPCNAVLLEEFGVIHVRGALSEKGQIDFWELCKPLVKDPKNSANGFRMFCVSPKYRKGAKQKRKCEDTPCSCLCSCSR